MATIDTSSIADNEDRPETSHESEDSDPAVQDPGELGEVSSTTLVEVIPGTAVVFGSVPDGLDLVDFGLIPEFDRERISAALSVLGDAGTIGGNVANVVSGAQGLYRVNDATLALLKSGGELAAKDGAKLGAIFKNGDLVAQARFIPYGVTAAQAVAALGPAIAMIGLQMQLSEISGLVRGRLAQVIFVHGQAGVSADDFGVSGEVR